MCLLLIFALLYKVLAGRSREEEEVVQSELLRLDDPVVQANNPFWMDRAHARVFAVLRLRVKRVPRALEYCCSVLGGIFSEFYPLSPVPSSLERLCRVFSQPAELCRVVNHQIHAGARAFAFVHSHWPGVDIVLAAQGPPGGRDQPMDDHYAVADKPASQVVKWVCAENDHLLGALCKVKSEPGD